MKWTQWTGVSVRWFAVISGCILMQSTIYQSDEQDNSRTKVFW